MRRLVVLPALAVVVVLLTGCASNAFSASGTMTLVSDAYTQPDPGELACIPGDGYSDVAAGTQVVVSDEKGNTVGVGSLGAGKLNSALDGCVFRFAVKDVPVGAKFYKVTISHRDGIQYTENQLRAGVHLSLGQ